MIRFDVMTLFPELIQQYCGHGLLKQGIEKKIVDVQAWQLRDSSDDPHRRVDNTPFGGGDGMIIEADVLSKSLAYIQNQRSLKIQNKKRAQVIYLSPQGKMLTDSLVRNFAQNNDEDYILICGRYAGVDERFIQSFVDEEISIGDYVLNGGELGALVFIETVSRMCPGFLGHSESKDVESFHNGLLEAPQFTKPRSWNELDVPDILLSGDHQKIQTWRVLFSALVTLKKRPDLMSHPDAQKFLRSQRKDIQKMIPNISSKDLKNLGLSEDLVLQLERYLS